MPAQGQDAQSLAILTEVDGAVSLSRAGSTSFSESVGFGTQLFENDRVRTSGSASVSIYYSNGDLLVIGANRTVTISDSSNPTTEGASQVQLDDRVSSSLANLSLHRSGEGEMAALSGLRSGGEQSSISVTSPMNSAVRGATPDFSWSTNDSFSLFRVRVFTSDGVVWEGESTEMTLTYPGEATSLVPGVDYLWKVSGEDLLDGVSSEVYRFNLLSAEDLDSISSAETSLADLYREASSSNYHFLLGSLYADAGLFEDAVEQFKALIQIYPGGVLAHELIAKVYVSRGQIDLAMSALRLATTNGQ